MKLPKYITAYALIIVVLLCLSHNFTLAQQLKVAEKSGKRPAWVNGLNKNYLIVTGSGDSIQQAEEQAIDVLQNQILSIVYEEIKANLHVQDSPYLSEKIYHFLDKDIGSPYFRENKEPFFKTIDISKATDFYWERLVDKKTKETFYYYHLRYPFFQNNIDSLAHDFLATEDNLKERINYIKTRRNRVTSVEEIDSALVELNNSLDYYDNEEKEEIASLISNYQTLYTSIALMEENSEPGIFRYSINLQGRVVTSSQIPIVSSNCATISNIGTYEPDNSVVEINYSTKNCTEAPDNYIEIRYNFGKNTISKRFYIISNNNAKQ